MISEHLILGMCYCVVFLSRAVGGYCKAILDIAGHLLVSLVEFERLTQYTFGFHLGFVNFFPNIGRILF